MSDVMSMNTTFRATRLLTYSNYFRRLSLGNFQLDERKHNLHKVVASKVISLTSRARGFIGKLIWDATFARHAYSSVHFSLKQPVMDGSVRLDVRAAKPRDDVKYPPCPLILHL